MVLNTQTIMRSILKTSKLHIRMWIYAVQSAPLLSAFCYINDACKCYSVINRFWHGKKLTLFMLGNFSWLFCHSADFFKKYFLQKISEEHYQSVKWFGSRSGLTFCVFRSGSKPFAKVISRQLKSIFGHSLGISSCKKAR